MQAQRLLLTEESVSSSESDEDEEKEDISPGQENKAVNSNLSTEPGTKAGLKATSGALQAKQAFDRSKLIL